MAAAFLPWLLPAGLAKPQLGLPLALTTGTKRGLLACAAVLALSFLLMPRWPWFWPRWFYEYVRFVPFLILPGPLLALAALRYRERDARLLLLMASVPQRWFYDMLLLWLIPKSRKEILATVGLSWVVGVWRWYHIPQSATQVARWTVLLIYLPMLIVVLARPRTSATESKQPAA
jgi:hypothetical protein